MSKTTKPDLLGVEPIDYVYRGSDGLIYRTIPQDVPVIETIPRYSAATVERLVQERDGAKESADYAWKNTRAIDKSRIETEEQLAAMTKKADGFFDALQLAAKINAEGQAREQQLREALETIKRCSPDGDWPDEFNALSLPQDDTALRQWGAKLLRDLVYNRLEGLCNESGMKELLRKADELEAGK